MVTELKEALKLVEKLKEEEQRQIAALLKQELSWQASFDKSRRQLNQLANEAIHENKSGK